MQEKNPNLGDEQKKKQGEYGETGKQGGQGDIGKKGGDFEPKPMPREGEQTEEVDR